MTRVSSATPVRRRSTLSFPVKLPYKSHKRGKGLCWLTQILSTTLGCFIPRYALRRMNLEGPPVKCVIDYCLSLITILREGK